MAVDYHLRHLSIAQELYDQVGEGRACWSLGNAHAAMGEHQEAYHYAAKHLEISKDTGDRMGQATAQLNLAELSKTLGYPEEGPPPPPPPHDGGESYGGRRKSMEHMDLLKMTPDASKTKMETGARGKGASENLNKSGLLDEEDFFDFISRFQSKRMDDQRCSLAVPSTSSSTKPSNTTTNNHQNASQNSTTTHKFNQQLLSSPINNGSTLNETSGNKKPVTSANTLGGGSQQPPLLSTAAGGPNAATGQFKQQKDELLGKYNVWHTYVTQCCIIYMGDPIPKETRFIL